MSEELFKSVMEVLTKSGRDKDNKGSLSPFSSRSKYSSYDFKASTKNGKEVTDNIIGEVLIQDFYLDGVKTDSGVVKLKEEFSLLINARTSAIWGSYFKKEDTISVLLRSDISDPKLWVWLDPAAPLVTHEGTPLIREKTSKRPVKSLENPFGI